MQPEQCLQVLINAARVAPLNYYQHAECDKAIQELSEFIEQNTPEATPTPAVVTNNGK